MKVRYVYLVCLPAFAALVISCASTLHKVKTGNRKNPVSTTSDTPGQIEPLKEIMIKSWSCISVARNKSRQFSRERLLGKPVNGLVLGKGQSEPDRKGGDYLNSGRKRDAPTHAGNISVCIRTEDRHTEPKSRKEIRNTLLWVLGLNLFYFGIFRNLKSFAL